jgi:hypothetical protein
VWARLPESLLDECGQSFVGWVTPADAERMAGRVGVYLVPLFASQVIGLEHTGAEFIACSCAFTGSSTWRSRCTC